MAALLVAGCAGGGEEGPSPDDMRYLVREACGQLRAEDVTAAKAAGILQDAARHGTVIDDIQDECGPAIAALFPRDP